MSAGRTLLEQSLDAMAGCVRRLDRSHRKLHKLFPLAPERIGTLSASEEESLDAFLKRFEQLVTTIQDQVFKGIVIAEGEDGRPLSRRDVAELMERLGALSSAALFRELVLLRNRLSHVYPDDPARQAAILNTAFDRTPDLLEAAAAVRRFAEQRTGPAG